MILAKGKWLAVLTAAVLLLAMLPAVSLGSDVSPQRVWRADGWESDDTSVTAKVLPEMSYHTFHQDDDDDYAKISAPASGTVFWLEMQATTEAGQDFDSHIRVYDKDGNQVGFNDDVINNNVYDSGILWEAPAAGDYTVCFEPASGDRGSYYAYIIEGAYGRRLAGATRFDTAVQVSERLYTGAHNYAFEDGPRYAVVANGRGYADALAGGVLASLDMGPLLLTEPGTLPEVVSDELERLFRQDWYDGDGGGTVYVLGGTGAVSPAVMAAVEDSPYVDEVVRLAGPTRYGTAAEVASQTAADFGGVLSTTAFVVGGYAWPDALAAGPVAAWNMSPLLLTGKSSVPQETEDALSDLGITDIVVVGGAGVVDAAAFTELEGLVSGDVTRVAGATRYETARAVAQWGVDEYGMNGEITTLVPGTNFPDALGAAPISWWFGGPMLLTGSASLHPAVKTFIDDNGRPSYVHDTPNLSYAIGGSGVISDAALTEWQTYKPAP